MAPINTSVSSLRQEESQWIARLKRAVISGGGQWVGIQQGLLSVEDPLQHAVCVFNHPISGQIFTLPVPFIDFSDEEFSKKVHQKIEESDKAAGERRISIKVSALRECCQRAQSVVDEITKIIEAKS